MSFEAPKTPNSPLRKVFEEAAKTFMLPSVLPHEVGALQTLLVAQQKVVQTLHQEAQTMRAEMQTIRDEAHAYVIRMLEQATLARQRMFGSSSEQMSAQSRLFDEAEVLAQNSTDAQDTAPIADEAPPGRAGHCSVCDQACTRQTRSPGCRLATGRCPARSARS